MTKSTPKQVERLFSLRDNRPHTVSLFRGNPSPTRFVFPLRHCPESQAGAAGRWVRRAPCEGMLGQARRAGPGCPGWVETQLEPRLGTWQEHR